MAKRILQFHYHGGKSGGQREGTEQELAQFVQLNRSKWASFGYFERADDGKVTPLKLSRPGLSASQMGTANPPDKSKKVIEDEEPEEKEALSCPHCSGDSEHLGNLGTLSHYKCQDCGGEFSTHQKADKK